MCNSVSVKCCDSLDSQDLGQVVHGELDALLVSGYVDSVVTDELRLRGHAAFEHRFGDLSNAETRQRLGTPLSEALKSSEGAEQYWREVPVTESVISAIVAGLGDPLVELRDAIAAVVTAPVNSPRSLVSHTPMLSRILRRWPAGGRAHAHIDPPTNRLLAPLGLDRRLAANVYLDNGLGGDLMLWTRMEYARYRELHSSVQGGVPHELIGEPMIRLHPRPGDLIVFDSSILHAVAPRHDGPRLTLSTFFGVGRDGRYWMFA